MNLPKVNLLEETPNDRPAPRRRFSLWKIGLIVVAAIVIIVPIAFSYASARLIKAAAGLNPLKPQNTQVSLFDQVRELMGTSERQMNGESRDRINILLMGIGGDGHDGPNLTDTILLVSIQPSTGKIGLLSIPRDLWVTIPNYGLARINSADSIGESKQAGSGGQYASQIIGSVLDQPIDYYIRVDFSAFKTLVDDVGGVTVNVSTAFTDYAYPTDDNLYQTVHFDAGWQTMNGDKALEFVRSRHGNNNEGSDFARSHRQQQVLVALKDKIVSFDTLLNPSRIASILETLQTHVITNMELWEVVKIAKFAKNLKTESLNHYVLDDNPNGPLYATSIPVSNGDAYALLPRRGDWTDVQRIARDLLDPTPSSAAPVQAKLDGAPRAPVRIEVLNGTLRAGLGQKTSDFLTKTGYTVTSVGNAKLRNVPQTTVYDLTAGAQPEVLSNLKGLLNASIASTLPPGEPSANADFVIILGQNAS